MHLQNLIRVTALLCNICFADELVYGQQLEPRAYAALPKNLNVFNVAYLYSKGNVFTDPALPVDNFIVHIHTGVLNYVRTFGLGNKLARVQVLQPYSLISGKLQINGRDTSGARSGFADTKIRFGINLTGSPPLDKREFAKYTQETIIGVSLVTSLPTGKYEAEKRINMGLNRFALKPEIGISKRFGRWYTEAYTGVWFYTNNDRYLNTKTLEQNPVFNIQVHGAYFFKNLMMLSGNVVWFSGGRTIIDGEPQGNLLNNWRTGITWSVPIGRLQTLRFQYSRGAFTTRGYDYNEVSVAYMILF